MPPMRPIVFTIAPVVEIVTPEADLEITNLSAPFDSHRIALRIVEHQTHALRFA